MEHNEENKSSNLAANGRYETQAIVEGNRKKNNSFVIIILACIMVVLVGFVIFMYLSKDEQKNNKKENEAQNETKYLGLTITDNSLQDFDLYFLQLENKNENMLYSPLSIKYALAMLEEGANGESKTQISNVLGNYTSKKYNNSANMSFANAFFVKNSFKDSVKDSYINALTTKYNASVIFDSFTKPDVVNDWVKDKTFNLIDGLYDNISEHDFVLTNALAIDMEWVNMIQSENKDYLVEFPHREFSKNIIALNLDYYEQLDFEKVSYPVMAAEIGAVANRYDLVSDVGEDNIRKTVSADYQKWLDGGACEDGEAQPNTTTYIETYMSEIKKGYNEVSSSTDFEFYVDDSVKVFAKDLKEYDGTTLQYIGIMPTGVGLDSYIKDLNASKVNTLINNLKPIELNSFKDGVITEIYGYIPMFKFEYELNMIKDLKELGITDVFTVGKADLSGLTTEAAVISDVSHKTNIEFSNIGIKAAAATAVYGAGATGCWYDYIYEVPVERIDMTFDKPYLFFVRDKESGEVWFTGTVYEPLEWYEAEENWE